MMTKWLTIPACTESNDIACESVLAGFAKDFFVVGCMEPFLILDHSIAMCLLY
jgi:hypothetical protein